MIALSAGHIPNYLVAGSPQGLRRLMLINNTRKGYVFAYSITYAGTKWYAWYLDTVEGIKEEIASGSQE